jgi:hypothetical protein
MELQYAAPQRGGRRPAVVLLGGIITSLLTLVLVYFLTRKGGDSITDWHAYYAVPIGAIGAGLLAGSGYAIVSWWRGVRLRNALEIAVAALLLLTYVGAQVTEWQKADLIYVTTRQPLGFWAFYRSVTPTLAWHSEGTTTVLVGIWMLRRLAEIAGFVIAGIIPLSIVSSFPYCHVCHLFMRQRVLANLPASAPNRRVTGMTREELQAYRQEQAESMGQAVQAAELLAELATEANAAQFREVLGAIPAHQHSVKKLPSRLEVKLISCQHCRSAQLKLTMYVGKSRRELSSVDLSRDFLMGVE